MPKTILVCGFGGGISSSVAQTFGRNGFAVAIIGRNRTSLADAAADLRAQGITAAAIPGDLSDCSVVEAVVAEARERLGPIGVVHWNAPASGAGDLTSDDPAQLRSAFDVSVTSLVAAIQSAYSDLKSVGDGAVLVTNGAVGLTDDKLDALAVEQSFMGAAIAKTAQHKAVSLLARKLRPDGIFVGEVVVGGIVRGTSYDTGRGFLSADDVARRFWHLYRERPPAFVSFLGVGLAGQGRP